MQILPEHDRPSPAVMAALTAFTGFMDRVGGRGPRRRILLPPRPVVFAAPVQGPGRRDSTRIGYGSPSGACLMRQRVKAAWLRGEEVPDADRLALERAATRRRTRDAKRLKHWTGGMYDGPVPVARIEAAAEAAMQGVAA